MPVVYKTESTTSCHYVEKNAHLLLYIETGEIMGYVLLEICERECHLAMAASYICSLVCMVTHHWFEDDCGLYVTYLYKHCTH